MASTYGILPHYPLVNETCNDARKMNANLQALEFDHSLIHAAATVSGNGISISGQQISLSIGTGATQVAAGNHAHSGVYDPAGTADSVLTAHTGFYDHGLLHASATVTGNGIGISGQQISLSIGTGATNVAAGNHTHTLASLGLGTSDTPQFGGLAIGRALSAGLLLDEYSAAGNAAGDYESGANTTRIRSQWKNSGGGFIRCESYGSNFTTGNTIGIPYNGNAVVVAEGLANGLAIGTVDAKYVVLSTNNTARLTIASTGEGTFSSTWQCTGLAIGRALTSGYLLDAYSSTDYARCICTSGGAAYGALFRALGMANEVQMLAFSASTAGNTLGGLAAADGTVVGSYNSAYLAIGCEQSSPVYVITNNTARLTVGASTGTLTANGVDFACDTATKGLVLKDTQATPHYWRVTVNNSGALVITDIGTTAP